MIFRKKEKVLTAKEIDLQKREQGIFPLFLALIRSELNKAYLRGDITEEKREKEIIEISQGHIPTYKFLRQGYAGREGNEYIQYLKWQCGRITGHYVKNPIKDGFACESCLTYIYPNKDGTTNIYGLSVSENGEVVKDK